MEDGVAIPHGWCNCKDSNALENSSDVNKVVGCNEVKEHKVFDSSGASFVD